MAGSAWLTALTYPAHPAVALAHATARMCVCLVRSPRFGGSLLPPWSEVPCMHLAGARLNSSIAKC